VNRRAADRGRRQGSHLGRLVREHHHRIADLELGMPDFSVRSGQPKQLLRAKRYLVELNRA